MDIRDEKRSNILSFNGFRYFFSLLIFLNHCTFLKENRGGNIIFEKYFGNGGFSVTFFFLLSGYCFALGYSDRFRTLTCKEYCEFITKRVRKIFPAYFVSMFIALLFQLVKNIIHSGSVLKSLIKFGGSFLWSCTMTQSWIYTKYWGIGNSAAWYISCLFFCYLLTPLIMHLIDKIIRTNSFTITFLLLTMIVCYVFIIILNNIWLYKGYNNHILYLTPLIRTPQFIIGLVAGYLCRLHKKSYNQRTFIDDSIIETIAMIILFTSYIMVIRCGFQYDSRTDIIAIPVDTMLMLVFSDTQGVFSKLLGNRFTIYLGRLSLYIYLFHYVVINCGGSQIMLNILGTSNLAMVVDCFILLLITIILSAYFMKYEEFICRFVRKQMSRDWGWRHGGERA